MFSSAEPLLPKSLYANIKSLVQFYLNKLNNVCFTQNLEYYKRVKKTLNSHKRTSMLATL